VIIDCETTDLAPSYSDGRGVIWELALIAPDGEQGPVERLWRMQPQAHLADAQALEVGQYYSRTRGMRQSFPGNPEVDDLMEPLEQGREYWSDPGKLAGYLAPYLSGVTLIGAVPSFDAGFLAAFLRYHGEAPSWHYRLRDIGSMAYGWLRGRKRGDEWVPPFDAGTDDFAAMLGVNPGKFERHSALGDCRLVAAMLNVIEGDTR
jgi:hypothetical protein